MDEEQIREARHKHWHASAAGNAKTGHDIYTVMMPFVITRS